MEAKGSDSGEYFGPCIRSVHCVRCAQRGALYSRTCNRSIACAVNATHAIFNPSITRSPRYSSGAPFCRVRSAASISSATTRSPANAQPGQCAIRVRQLETTPRQLMPLRPWLTIRSCTGADAMQRGDEGVGIDGPFTLGLGVVRIVLRVQGTEVRCVHGNAPYRTDSNATDGGGGRCVSRKPVNTQSGGSEDPHAPPAMDRERIASRRHPKMTPTGKRKALGIQTGFRVPRHLVRGGTPRCTRMVARCQETVDRRGRKC